jgi:hypothetical protein
MSGLSGGDTSTQPGMAGTHSCPMNADYFFRAAAGFAAPARKLL